MLIELNALEIRKILSQNNFARLGCVLESGEPHIVPINYFYKDEAIYSHSIDGLKISALRRNPKACLQIDEIKNNLEWRSIIAFGEFEEIIDGAERDRLIKTFLKIFQRLTPADAIGGTNAPESETVLFRIKIRRITSRAEG